MIHPEHCEWVRQMGEPATVSVLIEVLKQMPQDAVVLLSRDEEGNGYGDLSDIITAVVSDTDARELVDDDEELRPNAIILYPI